MTILLTQAIQVAGVTQPAGTTLTLEAGLEADLVTRKCATFVSRPDQGITAEVFARTDPLTGGIESLTAGGKKVVDLQYGDNLTTPSTTTTLTAAISTTATLSATASGTYRKARVSWINNGASASAKLYMSINADNDVQGMSACNSSRRRDHEMTMGDCIMLVCDTPITRINFTSDTSIASNTHRLMVTFGE